MHLLSAAEVHYCEALVCLWSGFAGVNIPVGRALGWPRRIFPL